ncbi:SOS response-associated peptidase [Williamsia sp. MIQD14]|uniref:SOS response-associated peptidase n=1 Tax=Williamsia sp. MIQD14 TaxID=3425703 RepID=UPI003DA144FE
MCGRYAVTTDPALLAAELDAIDEVTPNRPASDPLANDAGSDAAADDPRPPAAPGVNYNVAPTTTVMTVVRRHDHDDPTDDPALRVRAMRWGLVPAWTKDLAKSPLLFNARAESVAEKASFKTSLKGRRCLVPMDGWYEWRKGTGPDGKPSKTPYFMSPVDGTRLFMAGLWTTWRPKDADRDAPPLMSCTIITTDAVGPLRDIHDRMPLVMPSDHWDAWLDPDNPPPTALLAPPSAQLVEAIDRREVASLVNRVANNGPELLDPVDPSGEQLPEQGTLL